MTKLEDWGLAYVPVELTVEVRVNDVKLGIADIRRYPIPVDDLHRGFLAGSITRRITSELMPAIDAEVLKQLDAAVSRAKEGSKGSFRA